MKRLKMIVDKFENEREKKGMVESRQKHERVGEGRGGAAALGGEENEMQIS